MTGCPFLQRRTLWEIWRNIEPNDRECLASNSIIPTERVESVCKCDYFECSMFQIAKGKEE